MNANAIVLERPGKLSLETVRLSDPGPDDLVVEVEWSAISTGTERLLWEGRMPQFPGMGYPLVPGYESVGTVREAGRNVVGRLGERVFVPGARCYADVNALFGGASSLLVTSAARASAIPANLGADATLLALAATAYRVVARNCGAPPQLVIGHGVLGRLIARIVLATGAPAPLVWETVAARRAGAAGYQVIDPLEADEAARYRTIVDASGDAGVVDRAVSRLAARGEIVLAGFYQGQVGFAFAPAFMREATLRISAEFDADDMAGVIGLVAGGLLSLEGLLTHCEPAAQAAAAYRQAFEDASCLKMALDWRSKQ